MKYFVLIAVAVVALTGVQCDSYKPKEGINLEELISLAVSKAISLGLNSLKPGAQLEGGVLEDGISGLTLTELDLDSDKAVYKEGGKYSEEDDDDENAYGDDDNYDKNNEYGKGGVYRRDILNANDVEIEDNDAAVTVDRRNAEPNHDDDEDEKHPRGRRTLLLALKKKLLAPAKKLLNLG